MEPKKASPWITVLVPYVYYMWEKKKKKKEKKYLAPANVLYLNIFNVLSV
jgi:hypothetical protein